jgi:hypothetical protein
MTNTPKATTTNSKPPGNERQTVKVRSGIRAGGMQLNHNERQVVKVRSGIRAGGLPINHNERRAVKVRSGIRAGHRRHVR